MKSSRIGSEWKIYQVPVSLVRDDGVVYMTKLNYTFSLEPPPMTIAE